MTNATSQSILETEKITAATMESSIDSCDDNQGVVAGEQTKPEPQKLKSLKFFYVGLAWAFSYPSAACLIGYLVSAGNGNMT